VYKEYIMSKSIFDIFEYSTFESLYSEEVPWENAWIGHLAFAQILIGECRPSLFVELGTYKGVSFFSFCQAVRTQKTTTKCIAIDTWQGDDHVGFYDQEKIYNTVKEHLDLNYSSFAELKRKYFDDAVYDFEDESIDLLHIDGLHTYNAVQHDFTTWLPKVKQGGIIILHDVNEFRESFGAYRLWDEIALLTPEKYLFRHSHGLGVWRKPGGPSLNSSILTTLFSSNTKESMRIGEYIKLLSDIDMYKKKSSTLQDWFLLKEKEVNRLVNEIEKINISLSEKNAETLTLRRLLTETQQRETDLIHSRSMRITAPLRAIARWIRKR